MQLLFILDLQSLLLGATLASQSSLPFTTHYAWKQLKSKIYLSIMAFNEFTGGISDASTLQGEAASSHEALECVGRGVHSSYAPLQQIAVMFQDSSSDTQQTEDDGFELPPSITEGEEEPSGTLEENSDYEVVN
jgi:hypothetical protein